MLDSIEAEAPKGFLGHCRISLPEHVISASGLTHVVAHRRFWETALDMDDYITDIHATMLTVFIHVLLTLYRRLPPYPPCRIPIPISLRGDKHAKSFCRSSRMPVFRGEQVLVVAMLRKH